MVEHPNMTSPREVASLLEKKGLKPLKQLGQNFLVDGNIAQKIVHAAGVSQNDAVIEIGPGAGALTQIVAGQGAYILALELDRGLASALQELLQPYPRVVVIQGDALDMDWTDLTSRHFGLERVKLIANLPYNISSPLMFNLFRQGFPFKLAVLMFQKEVARRLVAAPGSSDYGGLTVICGYYTDSSLLFNVSRRVFWPEPGVDSAVISLRPRLPLLGEQEELVFWKIVRRAFQGKRKTIINSLRPALNLSREKLESMLREASVDPWQRPAELGVRQFANLSRIIYNYEGKLN